ncbi:MAG: vWA domain-containing protein [Bacteroidota bacterium]
MSTKYQVAAGEQWSVYREDAGERGEVILPLDRLERWHPYFGPDGGPRINQLLREVWSDTSAVAAKFNAWRHLEDGPQWQGMILPLNERNRLGYHRIRAVSRSLEFWRTKVDWYNYLQRVLQESSTTDLGEVSQKAIWEFLPLYAKAIRLGQQQGLDIVALRRDLPDTSDFGKTVPSQQLVSLLLAYACRTFPTVWNEPAFNAKLERAHPNVQSFFANRVAVGDYLEDASVTDLFPAFVDCFRADLPYVVLQDVVDNHSGLNLRGRLPTEYRELVADIAQDRLGDRLKRFVGRLSILERARLDTSTAPAAAPRFLTDYAPLVTQGDTAWHTFHPEEQTVLLSYSSRFTGEESIVLRGQDGWRQTLRYLTAPFLDWEHDEAGVCYPQWAIAPEDKVREAAKAYEREQQQIKLELDRIKLLLPKLRQATTEVAIRDIERKRMPFTTGKANLKWQGALDRQRQEILNRKLFREQKMEEFGVHLAQFDPTEKDIWLDELLRVEEEVRPYMAYVRKAFQAALPVGSTIEFNPYRHRHDGVEFDPDTVQDQDKWLRGEVMKTLRSRKEYASITQVNTFCLDFSRSMNHDLMRNLFKVVFLLVTGLEGRDTYDAIHFFGSKFLEAVDFTDAKGFTSRTALARILSKIATVDRNYVVYSGFGGTNISDAVEKSHAKIMAFSQRLEEERPDVRYVRSILVLTDGQPTVGVINLEKLNEFIAGFREQGNVSIKGIYLKHPDDRSDFIARIFGVRNAVEASSFEELIATFVQTMSLTYRQQRKDYRQQQKRKRLQGLYPDN